MWANWILTLLDYNNIHPQTRAKLSCHLAAPVCLWWRNSCNTSTNSIRRLSKGRKGHYCRSTLYYCGRLPSICIHHTVDAYVMAKYKKVKWTKDHVFRASNNKAYSMTVNMHVFQLASFYVCTKSVLWPPGAIWIDKIHTKIFTIKFSGFF